jgi:hypothetical protein
MPGTPTPFAGLPQPAEGDLPDVPHDIGALATRVDTVLALLCQNTSGSPATMPTTAQNLLGVGPSISSLQSTQSTQAGQITTLQGQVSTLQTNTAILANTPQVKQHQPSSSVTVASTGIINVDNVTLPTASYKRLMICNITVQAGWTDYATKTPLSLQVYGNINSQPISLPAIGGPSVPVQAIQTSFMCTVPAGNSTSDYVQYNVQVDPYTTPPSGKSFQSFTGPGGSLLQMIFIPWSNGPDLIMPHY